MNKILIGLLIGLLIVVNLVFFLFYCKKRDNYTGNRNYNKVPYWRKIHLTTKDVKKVPKYIFDKLEKYAKNYEYKIYTDEECVAYLDKNYGQNYGKVFKTLKFGAHKADLFRYAILYKEGGIYLDIKTDLLKPLHEIFKDRNINYSVSSMHKDTIYQGILYSPPKNLLYLKLIENILHNPYGPGKYLGNTRYFYKSLSNGKKLEQGLNNTKYDKWYLFKEKCDIDCKDINRRDKYGYCCSIFDNNDKIFNTRDPKYGKLWY